MSSWRGSKTLHPPPSPHPSYPLPSKALSTPYSNSHPQKSQESPNPADQPDHSKHLQTRTIVPRILHNLRPPNAPVSFACRKYDPPPTARGTLSSASNLVVYLARTRLCALIEGVLRRKCLRHLRRLSSRGCRSSIRTRLIRRRVLGPISGRLDRHLRRLGRYRGVC